MTRLEEYYNKFNEEKRFDSRHGQVEYRVSMKYIHMYLDEAAVRIAGEADGAARRQGIRLGIGSGPGRISVARAGEGQDV